MTRKIDPNCRRALRAAGTRSKVLSSAAQAFDALGFDNADIRTIAREAGLSTGSVFAHFADKEELFAAAFPQDHARRRIAEAICRAADGSWLMDNRTRFYLAADRALSDLAVAA
jgi:AcrR family transcriptional regulator